jgi:CPA2 family monovalent cation:H+ antiporter-2
MAEFEFLKSLVIIFGLSAVVVFILGKFRIPSIIGFLAAGVLLGPYGLELIKDIHLVEIFAEIGVVLLLFTIGLEFSLKNLLTLRKTIFFGGFLQVSFAGLSVFFLSQFTGQDTGTSIVLGGLTALSSTAIVLKLLFDRAEIDSPHGRVSLGILIFQDFCVVLFILLIPMLKGAHSSTVDVAWIIGKSIVFIAAVIVAARWIVPNALHQIVHTRMRELFVISIIFICLGTAYLTYELGFSLALGAFIAGLVVSESEYSYQAIADILPFKDSFNGLFFISVGMLMDVHFLWANLESVMLFVCVLIILKIFTTTAAAFLTGSNLRVSLHSGLILAQVGEFSFVLAVTALKQDLITDNIYQLFLSSAIISMLITPLFVAVSSNVSTWITSRKLLARVQAMREHGESLNLNDRKIDHVIIIGFGVNGKNLTLVLKELEVPYTILELNSQTVLNMRKQGEPIFYGDGTSQEILHKLGIKRAKAVVISISDPAATRKIVITARKMNPELFIVVKTRYIAEVEDLLECGADEVIPAEFETSIELFCRILHFYQMPKGLIGQYAEQFRKNHYSMFIKGETQKKLFHDTLALMPDVHYESFVVKKNSPAIDASIRSLDIQNTTGALVIAVRRDNKTLRGLTPDFEFQKGDIVFLIGDTISLQNANKLLFKKKLG